MGLRLMIASMVPISNIGPGAVARGSLEAWQREKRDPNDADDAGKGGQHHQHHWGSVSQAGLLRKNSFELPEQGSGFRVWVP